MRLSATNNNKFNPGVVESNSPIGHLANNWWNVTASLQSPPPHPPPLSHHYQFAGMKISILSPPERENELTWHYLSKFTSALTNCHFHNHFFSVSFSSSILASLQGRNPYLEEEKKTQVKRLHTAHLQGLCCCKADSNMLRVCRVTAHVWCWDLKKKISYRPDVCLGVLRETRCSSWKQSGETGTLMVLDGRQFPSLQSIRVFTGQLIANARGLAHTWKL